MKAKSHREAYPAQYTHSLCGRMVQIRKTGAQFKVWRVVPSMFGQLAIPEGTDGRKAYALTALDTLPE